MKKYTAHGIYINCASAPFVDLILDGKKRYETRSKNMLANLEGKRVFLIETGKGDPVIKGSAIIGKARFEVGSGSLYSDSAISGTPFDVKPGAGKWYYELFDVRRFPYQIALPEYRVNHGRSYTTFTWYE